MDLAFIDPQNAGTVDEKPASIAYGASSFESRGSDIGAIDADLADMLAVLTNGNLDLAAAAWIMAPATAVSLSLKRGADGARSYPEVTAKGGSLLGVPIVTSNACTATGSPGERHILLVQADEVLIADDGEGTVEVTEHAAVQMDDAPAGGEQQLVSLWQNGLVGVKAKRYLSWRRRRDEAVAILRSVQY
jgi:HK97 family phage major capsid protein